MKRSFPVLALVVTLAVSSLSFAQSRRVSPAKQIDSYVRSIDRLIKRHTNPDGVFGDTSDPENEKPKWTKFDTTKALDKFRESQETFSAAYAWRFMGKIVVSNFTLFDESGDWAQYIDHYFRLDGSTALVKAEFRTFEGECAIKQKYYFDRKGRRFRRTVAYFELSTNKPKKPCLGADALKFDYYTSVGKLPFAGFLRKMKSE